MNAPVLSDRLLPDRSPADRPATDRAPIDHIWPERLLVAAPSPQAALELATEGTLRVVWEGRFGPMLIEVRHGAVFVNGQPVEPAAAGSHAAPRPDPDSDAEGSRRGG